MDIAVKICGLKHSKDIDTAYQSGARYVGFAFCAKSPRNITLEHARSLAVNTPIGMAKVALTVDASNEDFDALVSRVPVDMLQLHGRETPQRVSEIKARYRLPVMKAISIATHEDVSKLSQYSDVCDQILVDAKPPKQGMLLGGNGVQFDWNLLSGVQWRVPWMLAGGLNAENVGRAIKTTGATQLDLSSSVESAPGVKDPKKIKDFLSAVEMIANSPK